MSRYFRSLARHAQRRAQTTHKDALSALTQKKIFSFRTLSIPPFLDITDEILDEFLVTLLHALVRRNIKVIVILLSLIHI